VAPACDAGAAIAIHRPLLLMRISDRSLDIPGYVLASAKEDE
jgi:hypothetical protein